MDELVKLVAAKSGVSESQAQQAVETVLDFLQEKLPSPVAAQLSKVVEQGTSDSPEDLAKGLGGLFGKK